MPNENFFYNGYDAASYGIQLQRPIKFSGAVPVAETIHVAGRNGNIVFETGAFENRKGEAECFCLQQNVEEAITAASSVLLRSNGYNRLETTNDPTHYWMARVVNGAQIENRMSFLNPFTIEFDCKPQRFLKDGENAVSIPSGTTLYNPTAFTALPIIHISGNGAGRLQVGEYVVEIFSLDGNITLDCDLQNAYYGTTNLNNTISAPEFPKLVAGNNEISYTGDWTVEIIPRWWTL